MSHSIKRRPSVVADEGWAWVVMIAAAAWNFMVGGTIKTFGMQYVEFLDIFNNTPSEVGLIGLVLGIVSIVVAPFSGRLSDHYPVRWMVMAEGVLASLSILLTAWAPNLTFAVVTYGAFFGLCLGLLDGPILASLGKAFQRRRNLANGISFAGGSTGTLIMAHVMAFSIETYSIRGALIILAGVWMHTAVIGAVLRPMADGKRNTVQNVASHFKHTHDDINDGDVITESNDHDVINSSNVYVHAKNVPISDVEEPTMFQMKDTGVDDDSVRQAKTSLTEQLHTSDYMRFLRNPSLMLTLFVIGCGIMGYYGTIVAFAPYMKKLGMTHSQTAWFMTVLGCVEIVCRIAISWAIDHYHIPPSLVLKITYFILAVAAQVVVFLPYFTAFLCYACVLGVMAGLCVVLMSTLLCDCTGVDRLGSAMGLIIMVHNITASLTSVIAGAMFQLSGSYGNAVRLHGGVYFLGSVVYTLGDVLIKRTSWRS